MGLFSGVLKIVPLFIFVRSAGCKINSLFCEPSADFACARANPYLDEYLSCWMNNDNNKTANTAEARPAIARLRGAPLARHGVSFIAHLTVRRRAIATLHRA